MMLAGLAIGMVAMSFGVAYWFLAPGIPLVLAGVTFLVGTKFNRAFAVAEGLLAAALFGLVFILAIVVIFGALAGLSGGAPL